MTIESLQSKKPWILGGVGAALLLIAVSWLFIIQPRLTSASDTQAQADNTDLQNTQLIAANHKLAESQRTMGTLRAKLVLALSALPATSALPEFTHEVTATAAATSLTLSNISIGAVAPATAAAAAPTTAPTPTDATASATPAPAPAPAPGASTGPAAPAQYQVNVTLTTQGPLVNQLEFVKTLQHGARRVLVTSTLLSGAGSKLVVTTQLNIFTAPMSTQQIAQLRKLLTTG